jgi:hypothetical protein
MNDELAAIAGKYEELIGRLQEKSGIAREEGKRQVDECKGTVELLRKSNNRLIETQKTGRKQVREKSLHSTTSQQLAIHRVVPQSLKRVCTS